MNETKAQSTVLDEILLSNIINKTLYWVNQNISYFSLPNHKDIEANSEAEIAFSLQHKAFIELGIAYFLMNRYPQMRQRQEFRILLKHIQEEIQKSNITFNMFRRVNLFYFYLLVYSCLITCDLQVNSLKIFLQKILEQNYVGVIERQPWQKIELKYYLEIAGFKHSLTDYQNLYEQSSAFLLPSPIYLSNMDTYVLTHAIFYLSDFGQRDLKPILLERYDKTREYIMLLLGLYTRKCNWDLVGELLMCCIFLQITHSSSLIELAWKGIFQAQNSQGFISGIPFGKQKQENTLEEDTDDLSIFRSNYHPTLVTLLASMFYLYRRKIL